MPYTLQSDVEIVNRALQILGDKRIVSLDDGSNAAKEMSSTFDLVRDCLIRSKNWLCCQKEATVALTGDFDGRMNQSADYDIAVPSKVTNNIQEMHIAVGHLLCGIIEKALYGGE